MKAGWCKTTLGAVAQVGAGNSAPQREALFADGIYPFFRTSDAGRVRFGDIAESSDYLNDEGIKGLRLLPAGTILFPKSGASTFLNHRVMLAVEGYVSSHLATIVGDESKVDRRFLLYQLSTVSAQDLVQDHAYPSLNLPLISGIQVMLPPLPEQNRIVAILDEAFERITIAKANAEKNLQNVREVFESQLESLFAAGAAEWPEHPLEQVANIINGYAFKSTDFQSTPGIRSIKITNVGVREFVDDAVNHLPLAFAQRHSAVTVTKGSIVLALTRTIIAGGLKVAVVPNDFHGALLNQRVAAIQPHAAELETPFLFAYLSTRRVMNYVKSRVNTLMQPNLSITDLRQLPLPLPAMSEQRKLVATLNRFDEDSQRLESIYLRMLAALEELQKSLLHQAFTGALMGKSTDKQLEAVA